ncbi:MAG: hypothetical protein HC913_16190 [Microscillaceae bacterium]|nr:hypothetical protein [Microscillaceae bacterium]
MKKNRPKQFSICTAFAVLALSWLVSPEVRAQAFAEENWQNGLLILEEGDTLRGELKFDLQNELVQIQTQGSLKAFTSRKVLAFQFFDRYYGRDRFYFTLPYAKVSNYPTPTFFELVYQDQPLTLLCRESLVTQTFVNNNPYVLGPNIPVTTTRVKCDFFFLDKNGRIRPFNGTKKGLLYLLKDREKDIKDFMEENRLRTDDKADMTRIIAYYNEQKRP